MQFPSQLIEVVDFIGADGSVGIYHEGEEIHIQLGCLLHGIAVQDLHQAIVSVTEITQRSAEYNLNCLSYMMLVISDTASSS